MYLEKWRLQLTHFAHEVEVGLWSPAFILQDHARDDKLVNARC